MSRLTYPRLVVLVVLTILLTGCGASGPNAAGTRTAATTTSAPTGSGQSAPSIAGSATSPVATSAAATGPVTSTSAGTSGSGPTTRPTAPAPDCALPSGTERPEIRVMSLPVFVAVLGRTPHHPRPAIVLSNQSDEDLCSYLPFAHRLTAAGYTVALYNYSGPPVDDLTAIVGWLRAHDASKVVLLGASQGAKVTVVAGADLHPAPDAVVSLSAESTLLGYAVEPSAARLSAPTLWVTAKDDPYGSYDASVDFHRVSPAAVNDLVVVPGIAHGTALLPTTVGAKVLAFLRHHVPPSSGPSTPAAPAPSGCPGSPGQHPFFLPGPAGSQLAADRIGSGKTVAVFLHEKGFRGMCGFAAYASWLSAHYPVQSLLIDFCGYGQTSCPGSDADATSPARLAGAAVTWARRHGAQRVVLVGASAGGGDALAVASAGPAVDAVVDLSGDDGDGVDISAAAAKVRVPTLYAVAIDDPLCPVSTMKALQHNTPAKTRLTVVTSDPGAHGWDLLESGSTWSPVAKEVAAWITG